MSKLVGRSGERIHALEIRSRQDYEGRRPSWRLQQVGEELSQVVQVVRWPLADTAPPMGPDRRICRDHTGLSVQAWCSCQLRDDRFADSGWLAKAEGFPE